MVHTPDSKMQLRNVGELMHPACCAVCGNGACEEGYVDLGVYYDYEGQIYLCMTCINKDLVEVVGLLSKSEIEFLQEQSEELSVANKQLISSLEKANERLSHYDSLLAKSFDSLPIVAADEVEQSDEESVDEFIAEREESDTIVNQSSSVEGHNDVSGTPTSNFEL